MLDGPPETASMKSGLVTSAPRRPAGKQTTGRIEEDLVSLDGEDEQPTLDLPPIPPNEG